MNAGKRIGVKITQDKEGNIIKEETHEVIAEELIKDLPLTTKDGVSKMTKEIIRKIEEN